MSWNDQPAWRPAQPPPVDPATLAPPNPAPATPAFGGIRRGVATAALAIGLLVVGGTAVVLAADPSASPAPSTTTAPSGGTTQPAQPKTHSGSTKNCPNMGGSGSGSGGTTTPSNGTSSSPATNQ